MPVFEGRAVGLFAPVALVLVAENLGHLKAVFAMTGRDLTPYIGRAFIGDGVATDITGANAQSLDALFVVGGIHTAETRDAQGGLDPAAAEALLTAAGKLTTSWYFMPGP